MRGKKKPKIERHYKDPLRDFHPATSVILAGYRSGLSQYSVKPPLFRTSTFEFSSAKEGAKFFKRAYHLPGDDGREPGLVYTRLNNPNIEIAEDKIIAAEAGATHAALFPSGMSAISSSILSLVPEGGKILYTDPVYGGTYFFFTEFCPKRFGIKTFSVDTSDLKKTEEFIKENGPFEMIYLETPANPTMQMTDIEGISKIIKKLKHKSILCVDNTFLGPVFQSPFKLGADLVLYSATKFIGGHSDLIAGVALTNSKVTINKIKDFRTILGATISPDNAWLLTRSIETVWVRMIRQSEKAMKVADTIRHHPKVSKVIYPGLLKASDGTQYEIFKKQCLGPGSMITIFLKNPKRAAAFKFLDALNIFHLAVSLGGTESLIQHPRSMTHSDMSLKDLNRTGITDSMIRISIGLESSEDLIADIHQALK